MKLLSFVKDKGFNFSCKVFNGIYDINRIYNQTHW